MMFINGFLFTLGGLAALVFTAFILAAWIKSKKKPIKATGKIWREYLDEVVKINDFKEAIVVQQLLTDKKDDDEIDTPAGYKVHVDKDLVIDENAGEGLSKIKVHKTLKIVKTKHEN